MIESLKTVELDSADKRGSYILIAWRFLIIILSVTFPTIYFYRVATGASIVYIKVGSVLFILFAGVLLPALLIFSSFRALNKHFAELRGNVKQIWIVPVERKYDIKRSRSADSHYIVVNEKSYPVNYDTYKAVEEGDLVTYQAMPVTKRLLVDLKKYEGEKA